MGSHIQGNYYTESCRTISQDTVMIHLLDAPLAGGAVVHTICLRQLQTLWDFDKETLRGHILA